MIFSEYATVTRSSNQTIDCKGNFTNRNYQNAEFLETTGFDAPPRVGEVGLVIQVNNDEFLWVGRLKQYQSDLGPNELRIHPERSTGIHFSGDQSNLEDQEIIIYRADGIVVTGKNANKQYDYKISEKITITQDGDIRIRRQDSNTEVFTSEIELKQDDTVTVKNENASIVLSPSGSLTITTAGTTTVNSAGNVNITAPVINLN